MNWLQLLTRRTVALPLLVVGVGVIASSFVASRFEEHVELERQSKFVEAVVRIERDMERRFDLPLRVLRSTVGLFAANEDVTRHEFRAYVTTRDIRKEFPGLRGVGFVERVPQGQLKRFVAAARADGAPDFSVHMLQQSNHRDMYVLKYIEPIADNLPALGLDVGSEATRRQAIERAIDTGKPTLTPPILLVKDGQQAPGFLFFMPVYGRGAAIGSVAQRRAALTGVLVAPLVAAELLAGSRDIGAREVDFELMTGTDGDTVPMRVYADHGLPAMAGALPLANPRFVTQRSVEAADRTFTLRARSSVEADTLADWNAGRQAMAAGLLITAALAVVAYLLAGRQELALRQAERMTRELAAAHRDNEALLGTIRTHAIVSIAGADGRIVDVNDAFCRISGFCREELIGQDHRMLNSGVQPPAFWQAMWQTISAGRPWRGQVCNRARDGSLYWVDSIVAPYRGADGQIEKYVSVRSDITASKRGEKEILEQRQRLANILEGTRVGTWEWNVQTGEILFNERWAENIGYTLAELGRDGVQAWLHMHPDDSAQSKALLERHIAGELPHYENEVRMRHKDGRWIWVQARGKLISRTPEGLPLWVYGTHTDITERKLAEQITHEYRDRFELAVDSAGIGVWEYDATQNRVLWDTWMHRHFGTDAALGHPSIKAWTALLHSGDRERVKNEVLQAFEGSRNFDSNFRVRWPDGQVRHLHASGRVVRDTGGQPLRMAGVVIDETEQRRAEEALQASRAFLANAGRIAGVGGWRVELEPLEILWSDETCRIHDVAPGFRPTMDEALDFYAPEAREEIQHLMARAIDRGEGFDTELPFITATGRRLWVRAIGEAEFEAGKAVRIVGAFQDVTDRRALEHELHRRAELQALILENLPCGVSVFNESLELVAANRAYRELIGFPAALFVDQPPTFETLVRFIAERGDYGEGDIETLTGPIIDAAKAGTLPAHEILQLNGRPVEVRGGTMPNGGIVSTFVDITERKRAEERVRRSEALLRGAIDTIDEAFVLYDPDDRLVLCNEKYRAIYAMSRDLIVEGARFEDILRGGAERGQFTDAVGRVEEWVAERLATHRRGDTTLVQKLDNNQVVRIVERRMTDGHTVGFRIDITSLVRAQEAAQEASRAKSRFLAHMSHEIRTPMNAILGMLALLRKTEQTPRQADYIAKSDGAARSLLALLNDVLDFSKIEADRMDLDMRPFRMEQLLNDLAVILSTGNENTGVELLFDIDPTIPQELIGDPMRLQQILVNLAGNALKFTSRGEVVVSIKVLDRTDEAATLDIAVRDTGIGIAPENWKRIFDAFTQAEDSTTRRFGGTGLGLAISQRLAGMMGSEIAIESELGKGSRFHFRLTLLVAGTAADRSAPSPPPRTGKRALVIDDNPMAVEVLTTMLESIGWHTERAVSGPGALEIARTASRSFDAVFIDWEMPDMDGWQVAQQLRELPCPGQPPLLVMVTLHPQTSLTRRSEAECRLFDAYLVKPVTPAMLRDTLAHGHTDLRPVSPAQPVQRVGARLAGLRVLVAEDNANNQQTVRELLEDEGASVSIVADGRLAVAAVASTEPPFDAVLMDLQMPEMDGLTAASRIRQDLGQVALPIVAMTANAMPADREACLAAGMTAHVGKPFDLDHLVSVLLQATGRRTPPASDSLRSAMRPLEPALQVAARMAQVDLPGALSRLGGNRRVYRNLLGNFVVDLADMPAQLALRQRGGEWAAAAREIHSLKGLAATLGDDGLAKAAARAEKTIADPARRADAGEAVHDIILAIQASLSRLRLLQADVDAALGAAATAAPAPAGTGAETTPAHEAALAAPLAALARQLSEADLGALTAVERLREPLSAADPAAFTALDEAVGRLDFERALQHCTDLIARCGA